MQGGHVTIRQVIHPRQLWDQKHKEGFLVIGKEVDDVGAP
jgi:hypothetical protein